MLSMSDVLDLSFYRWSLHFLEQRAAASATSVRSGATHASRTGPAARRFRRLLARINALARRDPGLLLDESDRQLLHESAVALESAAAARSIDRDRSGRRHTGRERTGGWRRDSSTTVSSRDAAAIPLRSSLPRIV